MGSLDIQPTDIEIKNLGEQSTGQILNNLREITIGSGSEIFRTVAGIGSFWGGQTIEEAKAYIKFDGTYKFKDENGNTVMDSLDGVQKLADASVTTAALAPLSVNTQHLANLAVEASKLADSSVTATKIANAAVGSAAIAAAAIGTAHIANGAIINAHIADATITSAKIASLNADVINAGTITGRTLRTAAPAPGVGRSVVITGGANQDISFYYDADWRGYIGGYTNESGGGSNEVSCVRIVASTGRSIKLKESMVEVNGNLVPQNHNAYDIGTYGTRWRYVYAEYLVADNGLSGSYYVATTKGGSPTKKIDIVKGVVYDY